MIRAINISDYEELYNLEMEIFNLHLNNRPDIFETENPLPYETLKNMLDNDSYFIYGYFENDKLLGAIYYRESFTNNEITKTKKIYFIEDIVVNNNEQHKGIGKKLVNFIENKALENDVSCIELVVWSFNRQAITFYESLGYTCKNLRYEKDLKGNNKSNKIEIKITNRLE